VKVKTTNKQGKEFSLQNQTFNQKHFNTQS